jgi:hypothetical protein
VAARKGAWAFATQQEGVGRRLDRAGVSIAQRHDYPVICSSSADVPDNVPESRAWRRPASRMITGERHALYRITGHYLMVVSVGRGCRTGSNFV